MILATRNVTKPCPFKGETDRGWVTVIAPSDAPELHELANSIEKLCQIAFSHEDFTREVLALLPEGSAVKTEWETAGWRVEVYEA